MGCACAQPQRHQCDHTPQQPHGGDRCERLRQIFAGLRHHLRRGAAPLHRNLLCLCPQLPGRHGASRCGQDNRSEPCYQHRAEDDQQEPPLHGGHHNRDIRLSASALRTCRHRLQLHDRRKDGEVYRGESAQHDTQRVRRSPHLHPGPPGKATQGPLPRAI